MPGFRFSKYKKEDERSPFDRLFEIFQELLTYTSGDINETLAWMNELDKEYKLTDSKYGMGDFIEDLKRRGYLKENTQDGSIAVTSKMEQSIRQRSLDQIFGKLRKSRTQGRHKTPYSGRGDEMTSDRRPFQFGDAPEQIDVTASMRNAQIHHGVGEFAMSEDDLEIIEQEHKTQTSTVLMIDISHSMILYGEDRITPAKKVAMALAELITTRYPKDTLDIIVFGDDAKLIELKDLPFLRVGPYHTNTVAGLDLALDLLRRRKNPNKQIFMITDGKPSCLKQGDQYYKNSFGLDRKIVAQCLNRAHVCRRLHIPVTTFMIAKDPYLQEFVEEFTEANQGRAFYTSLQGLGDYIFEDYTRNRRKRIR